MPFRDMDTLLGHESPFGAKLTFRDEDVLSGQDALAGLECPFWPIMPFLSATAILG